MTVYKNKPVFPDFKSWEYNSEYHYKRNDTHQGFKTRSLHAGFTPLERTEMFQSFSPPIVQSITYPYGEFKSMPDFIYGRSHNPTVAVLEEKLASLEGGEAAITACSGSQALFNLIITITNPGDNVVTSLNTFGEGYKQASTIYPNSCGVDFRFVQDPIDPQSWGACIDEKTKLVWIETPSNPTLFITDIKSIAEIAHAHNVPLLVDNTIATPALQSPFAFGADIVLHSISKFICGNATVLGGVIIGPRELIDDIRFNTTEYIGAVMRPFEAWLTCQFIETLDLRMRLHSNNAQIIAEYLSVHPKVELVNYPGLNSAHQHKLASRQMDGFSGLLSFVVKKGIRGAEHVLNHFNLIIHAVTFGTSKSLCMHPATVTHVEMSAEERTKVGISDGLLRLSVGLEDPADLIEDLNQALAGL